MSDIEKVIHQFFQERVVPVIESSIQRAVRQALAEKEQPASTKEKPYLDAQESAQYIGDELSTFYKRISRKEIPRHGPKGRIFCKKSDLDAFISQKQSKSIRQIHDEVEDALMCLPAKRGRRKAA